MDSPDRIDWRKLAVAARPTLERSDGAYGARHAGRPDGLSSLASMSERKERMRDKFWPGNIELPLHASLLLLHVKMVADW